MTITFLLGMLLIQYSVVGNSWVCTSGERLHTSKEGIDNCIICLDGTFMPEESHTNRQCYTCTRIENPTLEVEITKCNETHNAVIECICGYFRYVPRTTDGKEECKRCPDCRVPVATTFSESTTLIGVTEDAESRTRGTSVSTDTLHSHEQNKTNQSQNGVGECQTSVPADLYVYVAFFVTLTAILVSTFVTFVRTDKPATEHSRSIVACSSCTTSGIMIATGFLVLLLVLLLICALLKTGAIEASHVTSNVCVVITVLAAGIYVIAINFFIRRPKTLQVNAKRRPGTAVHGEHEAINQQQSDKLMEAQTDIEETSLE